MNLFYPVILAIGTFVGKEKDQTELFIAVHNQIAKLKDVKVKAEDVLLLLPHCLQYSECTHRVTTDVDNCKRCGLCRLADLLELRDKYGFNIAVATGGTLARKKSLKQNAGSNRSCLRTRFGQWYSGCEENSRPRSN